MMKLFKENWPDGFHDALSQPVITMAATTKKGKTAGPKVMDTELIYARVMGLSQCDDPIEMKTVLQHELSPWPPST